MTVFGVVFVGTLGGSGIETQTWIIERFEADARCVVAHHGVIAKELEKCRAFEFGHVGSGELAED